MNRFDRALVDAELKDVRAQRDQFRVQLAQAQNVAQQAMTKIANLDGAEWQLLALLSLLDKEAPNATPSSSPQ